MDAAGLDISIADAADTVAGTADVFGADDTEDVTQDVISSAMDKSQTDDKQGPDHMETDKPGKPILETTRINLREP